MLVSLLFLLTATCSFSQTMIFCENVTPDGKPEHPSHIFRIGKNGGFFQFLVILDQPVNSTEVKIDIFRVDETGKETFDATVTSKVEKDFLWFKKEVNFFKGGDYTIYAYNGEDRLLATGMVKVVIQ